MTKRAPLTFASQNAPSQPMEETQHKRPGRKGRQFIAAHVSLEAAKQFKILAIQMDTTTQDLLTQAINDLFVKHNIKPIA